MKNLCKIPHFVRNDSLKLTTLPFQGRQAEFLAYNQFFIDLNRLNVKKYTNKFVAATLASPERGGGISSRQ